MADLVAEVTALVDDGMRVKDACAQVIAAHPGAPSRRELYDAVLRSRDGTGSGMVAADASPGPVERCRLHR